MADDRPGEHLWAKLGTKAYYWSDDHHFIKRELPLEERTISQATGKVVAEPFAQQRLINEGKTLQFLAKNTRIPVPKVVDFGIDEHGLAFIRTELVKAGLPADRAGEWCSLPKLHQPEDEKAPCRACADVAKDNVNKFVRDVVLPELKKQTSCETGFDGFVMPPRWVLAVDERDRWEVKRSSTPEYVFVLHDLVLHNFVLSQETLEVAALLDTEESGFFPPEMQQWQFDRIGQGTLYRDEALVARDIALLS